MALHDDILLCCERYIEKTNYIDEPPKESKFKAIGKIIAWIFAIIGAIAGIVEIVGFFTKSK